MQCACGLSGLELSSSSSARIALFFSAHWMLVSGGPLAMAQRSIRVPWQHRAPFDPFSLRVMVC